MSTGFRILSAAAAVALFLPTSLGAQEQARPTYELPSITVMAPCMPENDPNSYLTYDQSARLYFYAGEFGDARKMMEQAAGVAEATGDMVSAAYRHVDAAFIAVWEGYPGKRREHVEAAEQYAVEYEFEAEDAEKIGALTRGVAALPVEEKN